MGCDIHFFVEKRSAAYQRQEKLNEILDDNDVSIGDDWELADDEFKELGGEEPHRNYALFSVLAGVRGNPKGGPVSEPRGLPPNASDYLKETHESWGYDAHSASYFTLKELKEIKWENYFTDHIDIGYFSQMIEIIKIIDKMSNNENNVRIVFWFDN